MHTTLNHLAIYTAGIVSGCVAVWLWRQWRRPAPLPATRHQLDRAARMSRLKLATPDHDRRAWVPAPRDNFDQEHLS